jgi:ribonuclease HI
MIDLYTDVSVCKGSAVATCFVISTDYFLGYNSFKYESVNSSLQGELMGIRDGLSYVKSLTKSHELINVYSDSYSAVQLIKSKGYTSKGNKQFETLVSDIQKLCNGQNVNFLLIRGHQVEHNPNKVVDLISNSVLRYKSNKNKE